MNRSEKQKYQVLLADDCANDRLLIKLAMEQSSRLKLAAEVGDGDGVIGYLMGHAQFNDRETFPVPDLLLLDLKMPVKDGFAVLDWLKSRSYQDLTVVVLTDSMEPEHIKRALDLGADLYQVKPHSNDDRLGMLYALEEHLIKASAPPRYSPSRRFAKAA